MSTVAYRLHDGLVEDEYYFSFEKAEQRMEENPDFEYQKINIE